MNNAPASPVVAGSYAALVVASPTVTRHSVAVMAWPPV
jgi:hypothetical protein